MGFLNLVVCCNVIVNEGLQIVAVPFVLRPGCFQRFPIFLFHEFLFNVPIVREVA